MVNNQRVPKVGDKVAYVEFSTSHKLSHRVIETEIVRVNTHKVYYAGIGWALKPSMLWPNNGTKRGEFYYASGEHTEGVLARLHLIAHNSRIRFRAKKDIARLVQTILSASHPDTTVTDYCRVKTVLEMMASQLTGKSMDFSNLLIHVSPKACVDELVNIYINSGE